MERRSEELRISDIFYVLFKHKILIITLAVCGLTIGIVLSIFSYMRGEMSRTYAITSAIAVTSQTQDGLYTSKERTPNSTDISLAENMTDSVIYVLRSEKTLNAAIRRLNLIGISIRDIYNNLKVSQYNSTQIIEMTLYWRNAEEGVEILNAINAVAPSVLSEVLQIGNVSVVNMPKSQYRIGGSVNAKLWIIMVIFGIVLGGGLSVMELFFSPKLVEPDDVAGLFKLDVFSVVPENQKYFAKKNSITETSDDNSAFMNECFLGTARTLAYHLRNEESNSLIITSATTGEGKSAVIARLAYQFSELGERVLLVDMDLNNPMLSSIFHQDAEYFHSINALYRGDCSRSEAVVSITKNLDLMPAVLEPNGRLYINEELNALVREMAKDYDRVLIDAAPIGLTSDVLALSEITRNVLFLIRCDTASIRDINDSIKRLRKSGMEIVGTVVNGAKQRRSRQSKTYHRSSAYYRRSSPELPLRKTHVADSDTATARQPAMKKGELLDDSLARSYEEFRNEEERREKK